MFSFEIGLNTKPQLALTIVIYTWEKSRVMQDYPKNFRNFRTLKESIKRQERYDRNGKEKNEISLRFSSVQAQWNGAVSESTLEKCFL